MPDEVEDVPRLAPKCLLEIAPRSALEPDQLDQPTLRKITHRALESLFLPLDIEPRKVVWGHDHGEDPERQPDC